MEIKIKIGEIITEIDTKIEEIKAERMAEFKNCYKSDAFRAMERSGELTGENIFAQYQLIRENKCQLSSGKRVLVKHLFTYGYMRAAAKKKRGVFARIIGWIKSLKYNPFFRTH